MTRVTFASIRVKGEAGEDKLTVESLELKEREREKDNARVHRGFAERMGLPERAGD